MTKTRDVSVEAWQVTEIRKALAEADDGCLVAHEAVVEWVSSWARGRRKPRPRS